MIFGIFRKIAMRTGFFDRIDNGRALFAQPLEVGRQLFKALGQHRHFIHCRHAYSRPS
jgi:hypothetical protein